MGDDTEIRDILKEDEIQSSPTYRHAFAILSNPETPARHLKNWQC